MKPLISIILPVYNTGSMLENTIHSILSQTFTNFELIIIDDGSKEQTAKLCDYFSSLDSRIRVFHNENGGTCAARNFGINVARGSYITFCDHDDIYNIDILAEEVRLINQSRKIEMAIVGATHIYDDGTEQHFGENVLLLSRDEIDKNTVWILKSGILGTVWNILYKKELIGETRFNDNYTKGHEDIIFNIEIYRKVSAIVSTGTELYYHFIRKSMSTSAGFHIEAVDAIKNANDKIYELCSSVIGKIKKSEYADLQGEYIRTYVTYLVNLGCSFAEFKNKLQDFQYIPIDFGLKDLIVQKNKDSLCFYCIKKNRIRFLYCLILINTYLKGRSKICR